MTSIDDGLVDLLRQAAERQPEKLYGRFEGTPITFGALERGASAFAAHMRTRGLERGDRVAVMMKNGIETLRVIFGLAKAGIVWVPINVQQRGEGLRYLLSHARPRLLVHDADLEEVITENLDGENAIERLACRSENQGAIAPSQSERVTFDEAPPAGSDPVAIMYTSGTTGRPKGVIVTHRMLTLAARGVALVAEVARDDVFLVWEPFYHVGGAQLLPLPFTHGVSLAMVERFSASRFWDRVRAEEATHIHYLGGVPQILLKQPPSPKDRDHKVRVAWGAGCPADTWRVFEERFGLSIRECYGMTEASSITTVNLDGTLGSVGKPLPWLDFRILDEKGNQVPSGERGEIVVNELESGVLFPGYLDNREATQKALRNGVLHTGDAGSVDGDGNLFFHGRLTDSVRCRGENVAAFEVESIVAQHSDVEDCAMIGVDAEIGEQDIKLFVKPKAGRDLQPAAIAAWLVNRLAKYQMPRYIALVDEFERTASQRIMKHRLSKALDDSWDRLAERGRTA